MPHQDVAVDAIRAFAKRPLAFRCIPAGRNGPAERFVAHVGHWLHSPAMAAEMSLLKDQLGSCSPMLEAFYAKHNGFVLYRDTLSDAAGVEALPIRAWAKATERMHAQVRDRLENEDEDTSGLLSCLAFARVPHSGNLFAVQTVGPDVGSIYYTDHETASKEAFASDFRVFISRITSDPVTLLSEVLGCFTRYSDGSTSTQWIPEEVIIARELAGEA